MVFVIGSSFTVENTLKGLYEGTLGRLSEWTAGNQPTEEDRFGAEVAQHYVDFIRATPWYEYPYITQLRKLWREVPLNGANPLRKWERRLALSFEYLAKGQYAMVIRLASKLAYGEEDTQMLAVVENAEAAIASETKLLVVERFADATLVSLPRYEQFGEVTLRLVRQGVCFREIAGNNEIFLTTLVPLDWKPNLPAGRLVLSHPILTESNRQRVGIAVPVNQLHTVLAAMEQGGLKLEHLYDY